ncbi:hypothetical protein EV356DRAFT_237570 [Viridothelium virens]|uniref:Uncharacterized protein n=1 Tax=Viridothelium virens TaxID=1048519 RepID=A0A6A6H4T7_VIRVR|nr:hypothetical protein EV356DRAFT_237570 [Viridothelium virens]
MRRDSALKRAIGLGLRSREAACLHIGPYHISNASRQCSVSTLPPTASSRDNSKDACVAHPLEILSSRTLWITVSWFLGLGSCGSKASTGVVLQLRPC